MFLTSASIRLRADAQATGLPWLRLSWSALFWDQHLGCRRAIPLLQSSSLSVRAG